jgi:hypothetical protein
LVRAVYYRIFERALIYDGFFGNARKSVPGQKGNVFG